MCGGCRWAGAGGVLPPQEGPGQEEEDQEGEGGHAGRAQSKR